jgi:hypothetical protein
VLTDSLAVYETPSAPYAGLNHVLPFR